MKFVYLSLVCSVLFPLIAYLVSMRSIEVRYEKLAKEMAEDEFNIEAVLEAAKRNDKRRSELLRARLQAKMDVMRSQLVKSSYYPPNGRAINLALSLPDECAANGSTGHNFVITPQPYPHAPLIQCEWCGVDFNE